jgi:hypothetical protein
MKALAMLMMALLAGCSSPSSGPRADSPASFPTQGLKTISVAVDGEVLRPQVYLLPEGSGVLEAVREKGGFTAWSYIMRVYVDRSGGFGHGGKTYVVDLRRATKSTEYDLLLKDGDTVRVPRGAWVYDGRPKELWSCPFQTTAVGLNGVRSSP